MRPDSFRSEENSFNAKAERTQSCAKNSTAGEPTDAHFRKMLWSVPFATLCVLRAFAMRFVPLIVVSLQLFIPERGLRSRFPPGTAPGYFVPTWMATVPNMRNR